MLLDRLPSAIASSASTAFSSGRAVMRKKKNPATISTKQLRVMPATAKLKIRLPRAVASSSLALPRSNK